MVIDLFAEKNKPCEYDRKLIEEAQNLIYQHENAVSQFNYATDINEIEAVIYRLKAIEASYSLLLKRAKLSKNCNIRTVKLRKI